MTDTDITLAEIMVGDGPAAERGPDLFKVDSNGKMRVWYVDREGDKFRVVSGFYGGSLVTNAWTVCKSKGKGKAQTTPEEQATKEVASLYEWCLKRDYYETPEEASGPLRNYLPMLAERWDKTTWEKWTARIAKEGFTPLPGATGVYYQPKLDGYCCVAGYRGDGRPDFVQGLQSREGLPILTAPHVMEALAPFFAAGHGPVHGELYSHDLRDEFEKLGSLLKKEKDITPEQIAEVAAKIQFHVYDYPGMAHLPFGERIALLREHLEAASVEIGKVIHVVETTPVRDEEHLVELTAQSLEDGYEGGIGRLHLPYKRDNRSWGVVKIKNFEDDEFDLVRIEEGVGNYAGYAKRAIFWLKNVDRSQGPTKDNTFEAGIKGKRDEKLAALLHEEHKNATVTYFGYTQGGKGKPRMGVAKVFHGPEGRTL